MDEEELLRLLTGERINPIHVCSISSRIAAAIQSHTCAVWLSRWTVEKQETKRQPADRHLYLLAPYIMERGEVLIDPPRHATFVHIEEAEKFRAFKVTIKATQDGREVYVVSLHKIDKTTLRKLRRRYVSLDQFDRKGGVR